jgi:hypothetical protein
MSGEEISELVTYADELFPSLTSAQRGALKDLVAPFPDHKYVRGVLCRLATESLTLPIPTLREAMNDELRRRGLTTEAASRARQRAEDASAAAEWADVERIVADASDADLDALRGEVVHSLPPQVARLVEGRDTRQSRLLKSLIAPRLRARQIAAGDT